MDNNRLRQIDTESYSNLGQFLLEDNLIDNSVFANASSYCYAHHLALTYYLVQANLLSGEQILSCCLRHFDLPVFQLQQFDQAILQEVSIPTDWLHRYRIIPLYRDHTTLRLGVTDPTCFSVISKVRFHLGLPISLSLINEETLDTLLRSLFPETTSTSLEALVQDVMPGREAVAEITARSLADETEDEPIVKLVRQLLIDGELQRASDIHCEPFLAHYRIRFRIDGLLQERVTIPMPLALRMLARIKLLANLDITEKRLPQDGRISMHDGVKLEIRVSTCPMVSGEKVVLRLFRPYQETEALSQLGFFDEQLYQVIQAIKKPYGLILVTGPTGSGKSATLYAMLYALQNTLRNIVTIEEPVEIIVPGINQVNINTQIGLGFAEVLRAILRQDPDVLMLGEIRDAETAKIALQAAATGHLVLGTLHANHTLAALHRLELLGLQAIDSLQSLLMVIAQRLVRQLCIECKNHHNHTTAASHLLPSSPYQVSEIKKCAACRDGYRGRTGVFEVLVPDNQLISLILSKSPTFEITAQLKEQGWLSLQCAGMKKISLGITNLTEIKRVITYA